MIVKMSHTNQETGRKGWAIYDNVVEAEVGYNQKEDCKTLCLLFKGNSTYTEYPVREATYLCNDEGKTVETIYPEVKFTKVEGDLKKDGRMKVHFERPEREKAFWGGSLRSKEGEVSDKDIEAMKKEVVDEVCDTIRKLAAEREDFFIVKKSEERTTVGTQFQLPTIRI